MRSETLKNAEEAVQWAKLPTMNGGTVSNYEACRRYLLHLGANAVRDDLLCSKQQYWPCLSRLLIMDTPTFVINVKPEYIDELDCQAGTALLCLWFKDITGHAPKVRSWRHARQEVDG